MSDPATPNQPDVQATSTPPSEASPGAPSQVATKDEMLDALKEIFDPEIPINIVDLGLIYNLTEKEGVVDVLITLTSPHCPVGDQIKARIVEVGGKCKGVKEVKVEITHNPPWSKEKLTFDGKLQASMLGIM